MKTVYGIGNSLQQDELTPVVQAENGRRIEI